MTPLFLCRGNGIGDQRGQQKARSCFFRFANAILTRFKTSSWVRFPFWGDIKDDAIPSKDFPPFLWTMERPILLPLFDRQGLLTYIALTQYKPEVERRKK